MNPFTLIKRTLRKLTAAGLAMGFIGAAGAAQAQSFTVLGEQIDCDHVRYTVALDRYFTDPDIAAHGRAHFLMQAPNGTQWVGTPGHIAISLQPDPGDPMLVLDPDKLSSPATGWNMTMTDDGLGLLVQATVRIDHTVLHDGDTLQAIASMQFIGADGAIDTLQSQPHGVPDTDGNIHTGFPHELTLDLKDCGDGGGGGHGGDPGLEGCFKTEGGVIECDPLHPGTFIYKMPVGPELGGKVIDLVSKTPGVSVFPPSQLVPIGGGVLEWQIIGAVPGMTVELVANGIGDGDIKHIAGPKEGLGLCCVTELEIVIPIDIDCPPPPPPPGCEGPDCCKGPDCPPPGGDCKEPEKCEPNIKVEKEALVDSCTLDGGCKYHIRVTNTGPGVYNGKIVLEEWTTPNLANLEGPPNAPWTCSAMGPTPHCEHPPVVLNPGQSVDLYLTFKPGAGWPSDQINNCARYSYDLSDKAPFGDPSDDRDCARIPICTSPNGCGDPEIPDGKPDLTLEKRTLDAAPSCLPAGDGTAVCLYVIKIHNGGDGIYDGPLNVTDHITTGAVGEFEWNPNPPWSCASDGSNTSWSCQRANAHILPGADEFLTVGVKVPVGDYPAREVTNCARLDQQAGSPDSCATADLPTPPEQGPIPIIDKSGPESCEAGADCAFTVTVTNDSDLPFNGNVGLVDGMVTGGAGGLTGAQIVSIVPPLGCDGGDPASLPFGCQIPMTLAPHEARAYVITVMLPPETALGNSDAITNCVLIGEPGIIDAIDGNTPETTRLPEPNPDGRHHSCATVDLELDEPIKKDDPKPECTNGMVKAGDRCVCPEGSRWNGRRCAGKTIVPPVIPPLIPPVVDPGRPECPRGMDEFRSMNGAPLGYDLERISSHGQSIICGRPVCERGWKLFRSRSAIPAKWESRRIGRRNSDYAFWCARPGDDRTPPPPPPLECWDGWREVPFTAIDGFKRRNYDVRQLSEKRESIWCVKRRPDVNPCPSGYDRFKANAVPKGWMALKRLYPGGYVCARPGETPPPLDCRPGWRKIGDDDVAGYRRKGWPLYQVGKGRNAFWCTQRPTPTTCQKPRFTDSSGICTCGAGKRYDEKRNQCLTDEVSGPCPSPSKEISWRQARLLKKQGWTITTIGKGRGAKVCGTPGTPPSTGPSTPGGDPVLQCPAGYQEISWRKARLLKKQGWSIVPVGKGRGAKVCGKPGTPQSTGPSTPGGDPVLQCPAGYQEVASRKARLLKKQGWSIVPVGKGRGAKLCGKPGPKQPSGPSTNNGGSSGSTPTPVSCPTGYSPISRGQALKLRRQGWAITTVGKGRNSLTCGKAGARVVPQVPIKPIKPVKPIKPLPNNRVNSQPQRVCPPNTIGKWPNCRKLPTPRGQGRNGGNLKQLLQNPKLKQLLQQGQGPR